MKRSAGPIHILFAITLFLTIGCESSESILFDAEKQLVGPTATARANASATLRKGWASQKLRYSEALAYSEKLFSLAPAGPGGVKARNAAIIYAAAVLDAMKADEPSFPIEGNQLFMQRVGVFAYRAAMEANSIPDKQLALDLATAGPTGWQTEYYWTQNLPHDMLVTELLVDVGRREEAIRRLSERAVLNPDMEPVYAKLLRPN